MKKTASDKLHIGRRKGSAGRKGSVRKKSRTKAFKLGTGIAKLRLKDIGFAKPHDWSRFDAMTAAEKHAAALRDPYAQPITEEREAKRRHTPQVSVIRRTLKLSQEEFAERFAIPIGTLRDWEQGRKEPDTAARAYLVVIASIPEAVIEALAKRRRVLDKLKAELDDAGSRAAGSK